MRRALIVTGIAVSATAAAAPDDLVARPLVLAQGQVAAELVAELNLGDGGFAVPYSLAPDAWVGVTRQLTLGVIFSNQTRDVYGTYGSGFPPASFCFHSENAILAPLACRGHVYHGGGLDALWGAYDDGHWAIAPRVRLLLRDVDPDKPAMTIGALARWHHGRIAVWADPYLQIGFANQQDGNSAQLFLPIALTVQPACRWAIDLRTGWNAELDALDGYSVPGWLGARVVLPASFELGAAAGFPSLLGTQNNVKERELVAMIGWRS